MNEELRSMFQSDQAERFQLKGDADPEAYLALRDHDRQRRERAQVLIESNEPIEAEDYYHAAMLFQHGETVEDIWLAHTLALKASEMGYKPARWLAAASLDRWLMYSGKPQKYGTQYVSDRDGYRLWEVDPATTDEDRAAWDVPPPAEKL